MVAAAHINQMSSLHKYPRTPHLPSSPGRSADDKVLKSTDHFVDQRVVVTTKMDGENTTLYRDYMHARSLTYAHHDSRSLLRAQHAAMKHLIPENFRICGENLYARHSIAYEHLCSHFQVFSIWNEKNRCLSWNDTLEWCQLLELQPVPVLYDGGWDPALIQRFFSEVQDDSPDPMEGYVVRLYQEFGYGEFPRAVAKYVRANHVTCSTHWKAQAVVPNGLSAGKTHSKS